MQTHLVTGGSGFIGAGLVKELLAENHRVRVFDDNSRGHLRRLADVIDKLEFIEGNVCDGDAVRRATEGCDVVWHLAYINGTRHFYERPDAVLEVGVKGTLNTIDAAIESGVTRYVFASTSETYNTPTHIPTTETERLMIPDITNPRFSYGGGKITGELLTLHYAGRRGLETVIVRPHNIYGPDMGFAHVIPEVIERIIDVTDGLTNTRVELDIQGDGSETRAFCYIDDGARGFRIAGVQGETGHVYHLGQTHEVSIADLILSIGRVLGVELSLKPGPLRAGGTHRRCPDVSKLEALGYRAQVDLDDGLGKTVEWYARTFMARRSGK
ncbi:MAG: NAD-dependent epimerase/dehydratase family protein [Myxococcota bacterium]|nr:NAD-dependent epimerase/dehydratase family protein [Myxococcota bacterium]